MRRLATALHLRPRLALALLLAPPLLWLGVVYLGSLLALVTQSFFRLDDFTGLVVRRFTLATWRGFFTPANLDIVARSVAMAAAVTVAAALLAFPLAYYMARYARARTRAFLMLAVLMPLWSSYLVRVYFWKLILAKEGVVSYLAATLGLGGVLDFVLALPVVGGPSLSVSPLGAFVAFVYVWLPYMVLPVVAALERVPPSLVEASFDLGARPPQTLRHVTLPLALPGLVAGGIFTFSLTLGDFVVPGALGNSSFFLGQAVLMVLMAPYLVLAKRLGAFEAL
jgi:putative spermidine/putrescine transport system permease protein